MANFYASYPIAGGGGGGGSGTVTSVALLDGSSTPIYTISGSPVTTNGTLTFTLATETANKVFAGPTSGGAAQPTFRSIVVADLPTGNLTDAGTDGIVVTGGTGAVVGSGTSIAQHVADTTHNGYLSSTDWNTFNNKQAALTIGNLTDAGTDGIVITGGTGAIIGSGTSLAQHVADSTHNGYLSSTDWTTFNNKQSTITTGNLTDAGTDGIVITGGTGAIIGSGTSIAQHVADSTHNGYLSSTDWSTFNSKGSGSVTSVAASVPSFLSIAGSPIMTTGTLAISYSGTALPIANGGTGLTSGTSGGILGYTASGTLASSGALTANQLVIGGGAGATPSALAAGSQYQSVVMGASNPGYGAVNLGQAAAITGTLPVGNGGTGVTSVTTSPTASAFAGWDANKNISADVFIPGFTTTATAAGTTTLTVDSAQDQIFTGSTTQTVTLPVTSTLVQGFTFKIKNDSSGVVTVQSSGTNSIQAMAAGTTCWFECVLTSGTSAASWTASYIAPAGGSTATTSVTGVVTSYMPIIKSGVNVVSSAGYTITETDGYETIAVSTGNTNRTITLATASSCAGRSVKVIKTDTGTGFITFSVTSGSISSIITQSFAALGGTYNLDVIKLAYQDSFVEFYSDGTTWYQTSEPVTIGASGALSVKKWQWQGGTGGSDSAGGYFIAKRNGFFVTLYVAKDASTSTSGTANTSYKFNAALPDWAIPTNNAILMPCIVSAAGVKSTGSIGVDTSGNISLYYTADGGTTVWPTSVTAGITTPVCITYITGSWS